MAFVFFSDIKVDNSVRIHHASNNRMHNEYCRKTLENKGIIDSIRDNRILDYESGMQFF